jgi:hypothetical protein
MNVTDDADDRVFVDNKVVVYDELKLNSDQNIYSTPTNKELSSDDRKSFAQNDSIQNTSTSQLLP